MKHYYYMTRDGSLRETTHQGREDGEIELTELEYLVAQLFVKGFAPGEILSAVRTIFAILASGKAAQ